MKTLLEIVTDLCDDFGLDTPSSVIGSTDPNVRRLLRLCQKSGEIIASRHDWQVLTVLHTWTSVADFAQPSGPQSQAAYDRLVFTADLWDRTNNRRWVGPAYEYTWQSLLAGNTSTGAVVGYWRIIGNVLNLRPTPVSGLTLAMEYISNRWCASSGGTAQNHFQADSDVPRIPDKLIILDVGWRWKHANGLDYAEDMADFERQLELAASRDRGLAARTLTRHGGLRMDDAPVAGTVDEEALLLEGE